MQFFLPFLFSLLTSDQWSEFNHVCGSQVRIVLNKADEITAEELLRIQGNLVWNVSPLMASAEPPTLYAGSFWSRPYKVIYDY